MGKPLAIAMQSWPASQLVLTIPLRQGTVLQAATVTVQLPFAHAATERPAPAQSS
jgi:hypothetical protein